MDALQHPFPLHRAYPPPALANGPPLPLAAGTPLMPESPWEVHIVVDLPDTLEIVVLSPDDEPIKGLEDHLEDEDDPEEDYEIDKVGEE